MEFLELLDDAKRQSTVNIDFEVDMVEEVLIAKERVSKFLNRPLAQVFLEVDDRHA